MDKFKNKLKYQIALGAFLLTAVLGVGFKVNAELSLREEIAREAGREIAAGFFASEGQEEVIEEALGARNDGIFTTNQECWGGDCTFHINGAFLNNSTTIVSIPNPFLKVTSTRNEVVLQQDSDAFGWAGATSTVDLVRLQVENTGSVTGNMDYYCGAGPNTGTTTLSRMIIMDVRGTTGTPYLESGITSSTAEYNGFEGTQGAVPFYPSFYNNTLPARNAASTTVEKILLTPINPYLVCTIKAIDGVSTTDNRFEGKFTVRINRQR